MTSALSTLETSLPGFLPLRGLPSPHSSSLCFSFCFSSLSFSSVSLGDDLSPCLWTRRSLGLGRPHVRGVTHISLSLARALLPDDDSDLESSMPNEDEHSKLAAANGNALFSAPPSPIPQEVTRPIFDWTSSEKELDTLSIASTISGSGRAGLFRTPICGGVQSATSSHGLPHPALAVRNLMEQAKYAHLCTIMSRMHHRRQGYPFGSLVDFVPDSMGHPIFSLSPLAIHTRNLLADPRCTLVVQIPGWSGLSNARVTIFGDVYPLPPEQQDWAHKCYSLKHQQGASQQWGNFNYYRMESISDIYFIGGFGTVAWVDVKEFENSQPDLIATSGVEQVLKELNAKFSRPLRELLSREIEVDDAAFISIDSKGTDIRVRQGAQFNTQRLSFEQSRKVETLEQAKAALEEVLERYCKASGTS